MRRTIFAAIAATLATWATILAAPAQSYPNRPITLVVPFPPGGSTGIVARVLRPTLDTLGIVHHTLTDESRLQFILDTSIKQAITTQAPVAFILSPLLTGGNPAAHGKLSN